MSNTVIVFGPTGSVGSFVAIRAGELGAKVWLAMRDTSKTIPGLSKEQEQKLGYERVQADLTDPASIEAAVKKSGAKRASIYLAHGSKDHMKGTIEALKAGGIELVVFLSSYTIRGATESVPKEEIIPYIHAQVEIQLESIMGPTGYVAIRPGAFATNVDHWIMPGIKKGHVLIQGKDVPFDFVTPEDMGGVVGTVLAKGPPGQKIVYVFGPQFISFHKALAILQEEGLIKPVKSSTVDEETNLKNLVESGWPEPIAKYICSVITKRESGEVHDFAQLEEGQNNVQKYLGRPGFAFKEWAIKNKSRFA